MGERIRITVTSTGEGRVITSLEKIKNLVNSINGTPVSVKFDENSARAIQNGLGGVQNQIRATVDNLSKVATTLDKIDASVTKVIKAQASLTRAQASQIRAQAQLKAAENALAIEREKTTQATEARVASENRLAMQMEKTATAEETARAANTNLQTQIEKTRTAETNLALQQEKTATAQVNLQTQTEKTATAQVNLQAKMVGAAGAAQEEAVQVERTGTAAKEAEKQHGLLGDSLGKIAVKMFVWQVMGTLISAPIRAMKQAVAEMKNVDTELVTIQKVTNATAEEMDNLEASAYKTAAALGATASSYLNAIGEFSKAGYGEQAEDLGELAIVTAKVGDTTQETANQFLLAVDKAYGFSGSVKELTGVLDGVNEIGNRFATDVENIASGLGKIAPIASQAHVGINELSSAIGTITAVTQRSGTEAATALRALFLNIMGDTKTEIEDGATWTAGEIEGLRDVLKLYASDVVEAADATGTLINPMEAIGALAQSMKDGLLTEQTLMEMVSDIGGKLRTSQLLALIQNWDMYEQMLETYAQSAGSAAEEYSIYLDSWEAKANQLDATWTQFVANTVDSDLIKWFMDAGISVLDFADSAGTALTTVGGLIAVFKGTAIVEGFAKSIDKVGTALSGAAGAASASTTILGLTLAAIGVGTMLYRSYKDSLQEAAEASLEAADDAIEHAQDVSQLYGAYKSAEQGSDDFREAALELGRALGEDVSDDVDTLISKLDELTAAEVRAAAAAAGQSKYDAGENLVSTMGGIYSIENLWNHTRIEYGQGGFGQSVPEELIARYRAVGNMAVFHDSKFDADDVLAYYNELTEIYSEMQQLGIADDTIYTSNAFNQLKDAIALLTGAVEAYNAAITDTKKAQALDYIERIAEAGGLDTQAEYNAFVHSIENNRDAMGEYGEILLQMAQTMFPAFAEAAEQTDETIEENEESFGALTDAAMLLSEQVQALIGSISQAGAAWSEFEKDGKVSVETLGKINEAFSDVDGIGVYLNALSQTDLTAAELEQVLQSLILAKVDAQMSTEDLAASEENLIAKLLEEAGVENAAAAAHILAETAKLALAMRTDDAAQAVSRFCQSLMEEAAQSGIAKTALADLVAQESIFNNTGLDVSQQLKALQELAVQAQLTASAMAFTTGLGSFMTKLRDAGVDVSQAEAQQMYWDYLVGQMKDGMEPVFDFETPSGSSSSSAGSGSGSKTDAVLEAHEERVELLKSELALLEEQDASAGDQIGKIREIIGALEEQEAYMAGAGAAQKDLNELAKERLSYEKKIAEIQKDLWDELDAAVGRELEQAQNARDRELAALDEEKKKLEENRDLEQQRVTLAEKELAVAEALKALEDAKNERTIRRYENGEWKWVADEKAISDAQETYQDAVSDLEEYRADLAYQAALDAIEARRDAINAAYDAIEAQWDAITDSVAEPTRAISEILADLAAHGTPEMKAQIETVNALLGSLANYIEAAVGETTGASYAGTGNSGDFSQDKTDYSALMDAATTQEDFDRWAKLRTAKMAAQGIDPSARGIRTNAEIAAQHGWVSVYDSGGVLHGRGAIKASGGDEVVLDPSISKRILEPASNERFAQFAQSIGMMFGVSEKAAAQLMPASGQTVTHDNHSRNVYINGVKIGQDMMQRPLSEVLSVLSLYAERA